MRHNETTLHENADKRNEADGRRLPRERPENARTQIDVRREELLDQRPEGVGFGETRNLVAELDVGHELLLAGPRALRSRNVKLDVL